MILSIFLIIGISVFCLLSNCCHTKADRFRDLTSGNALPLFCSTQCDYLHATEVRSNVIGQYYYKQNAYNTNTFPLPTDSAFISRYVYRDYL